MIDVRELQKRGVVRLPKRKIDIPKNEDGFVELGKQTKTSSNQTTTNETQATSNADFFGFMDTPTTNENNQSTNQFNNSPDGYNKREVDTKITNLDNKIYKLEQRIELLERKLEVGQSSEPSTGAMGW